ncbi:MAG: hypothetical protein RSA06_00865 [Erysipelotrichaceae bacterium]
MLLIYLSSLLIFSCFILFGNLMLFLDISAYLIIGIFACIELFFPCFYKTINYKTLEIKDYFIALIIVIIFAFIYFMNHKIFDFNVFSYLYLSVYVSLLSYACSYRYKSLI